jgi:uncharacterized protein with GYD domain
MCLCWFLPGLTVPTGGVSGENRPRPRRRSSRHRGRPRPQGRSSNSRVLVFVLGLRFLHRQQLRTITSTSTIRERPTTLTEVPLDYSAEMGRLEKERGCCLREAMPKYLTMVSYTPEGIKGLVKEGGTARRAAVEKMLQKLGGRLEGFYFAFGDNDAYVISEGPDNATAAAISLAITTGAIRTKTVVLLTPEEVDQAISVPVDCHPAGK